MTTIIRLIIIIFTVYNITDYKSETKSGPDDFTIYVREGAYNDVTEDYIRESNNIKFYKYLSRFFIDRKNKNVINYDHVDEGIERFYPNKFESGFLSVNIENKIYQNVKKFGPGEAQFEDSIKSLVQLIKYIKEERPNVSVGIYGIPFRFYWKGQEKKNSKNKYDPLMKVVDYISPSLYILYPDKQFGKQDNIEYLEKNLQVALEYGKRFDKPVIPYVWHLIHPANDEYGRNILSRDEMFTYLNTIKNYTHLDRRVNGVIWWEPSKTEYNVPNKSRGKIKPNMTKDDIFIKYIESYNKQIISLRDE